MTDNPINNVLNILRLIRDSGLIGNSVGDNLAKWAGAGQESSEVHRWAAFIQEQSGTAIAIIQNSSLTQEAKNGLVETVSSLKRSSSIMNLSNSMASFFPQIESSISSFAILASVYGEDSPSKDNKDVKELVEEIDRISIMVAESGVDPLVKSTAEKHIRVLKNLLENLDSLGVDAAMAAYAELIIRLRRSDLQSGEESKKAMSPIWSSILKWNERLQKIEGSLNTGKNLLSQGVEIGKTLIGFLP